MHDNFKELLYATFSLVVCVLVAIFWLFMNLFCVGVVISLPVLVFAGIFKIICIIFGMTFVWPIPVMFGLTFLAIFGLTAIDSRMD